MADIGDKLRSAREAKGLSIADIEKATKIQGRYLSAIEENDFDKLPGDFYVRAFIRQYAQIVGLDGKKLLSEYHKEIPKAEPEEYVEESLDNKSEEVRKTTSSKKKLWRDYLPRIAVGVGIIVVILVCYTVYAHFSSNNSQNNNEADQVAVSSEKPTKHKKRKVKKNKVKIKQLSLNQYQVTGLKKNRNMVIRAGDQATTVTISMNGVNQGSQTLTAGQKHTVNIPENAQSVVVTFSNAQGTSITIGAKKVPYNVQSTYLSLTFFIGKHHQTQPNTNTNGQNNNSGTTTNNPNSGHSSSNQSNQNQQQSNNNSNSNGNGQTNNQTNSGQNNNQTGHENNQSNSEHTNQSNHSSDSSSTSNGGKE